MEQIDRPEHQNTEQITEQIIKPITTEQDIPSLPEPAYLSPTEPIIPFTEDLPSMPRISQNEGYGHGVSIDSMIVTPRDPILGEQLPNVGTSTDVDPNEVHQDKMDVLKHAASMVVAMTFSIGQDLEDQRLELISMITLAEDRQERIHTLESLLKCERKDCTELHQRLSSANEELLQINNQKRR